MNLRYVSTTCLMLLLVIGCQSQVPDNSAEGRVDSATYWTITEIRDDRGHDTIRRQDGNMYHDYFCAVILSQTDNEPISLIYVNSLPAKMDLKVGAQYEVVGLDSATYSENWRGYWLHDVNC